MKRAAPQDPTALDPAGVAYHQLVSSAPPPDHLAEALERSPLFRIERLEHGARAEWMQATPESDRCLFPLGRVCLHPEGLLLEGFSEERLRRLRACMEEVVAGRMTTDQTRVFRVDAALARPERLHQPLHERGGETLTAREVAVTWLRMAWPFLPREELGGRTPQAALHTGRGRAAVERIVEHLPRELRRAMPAFPAFAVDALREILLPREGVAVDPAVKHPQPAGERRRS